MRLGTLPFFVLASLIVFFWTRHASTRDRAIATALFTLLRPCWLIAGLATTDMGLTACLGAAFYSAISLGEPRLVLKRAVLFGLATAAAALAKFTALIYYPAAILLA